MDGTSESATRDAVAATGPASAGATEGGGLTGQLLAALKRKLQDANVPAFDVVLPNGETHALGGPRGGAGGAPRAFRLFLRTPRAAQALASLDEYEIAEAYASGEIDLEGDFLAAFSLRRLFSDGHPLLSVWRFIRPRLFGRNRTDKKAIESHYDLGNDFYWTFLDKRHKLYSQALYRSDTETLEDAAENKLQYICDACRLSPGSQVLDVGAGWGSFSRFAATRGIDVTMLTLSNEQFAHLSKVAAEAGPGKLQPNLTSIYELGNDKRFDAIVLLGVMEHLPDYYRLMRKFDSLLKPGGCVYMDFAAGQKKYDIGTFAHQVVFPGDHSPVVMHDLLRAANERDFEIIAIHNDRHSYYLTCKAWAERLEANRRELVAKFGERAFRSFQLYLWSIANSMHTVTDLLSYRMVIKKSIGLPSEETLGPQ